jgi:transposase InsO family protein
VRWLCALLGVAPSGYYRWCTGTSSARQRRDVALTAELVQAHAQSRRTYGAPRLTVELRARGVPISKRRCARLMRAVGLRGRTAPRRQPRTTDSRHGGRIAPNLVTGTEPPHGPNQVWATDITYLRTDEGWLYLAAVLDVWSRRIVGWACAPTLHASLTIAALQLALRNRRPPAGLIHHSDRGCQYAEAQYLQLLHAAGLRPSMSRAGSCYDNALIESLWSTFKTETGLINETAPTRARAHLISFDYFETFYNPVRRHSSLGFISPVAFEKLHNPIHLLIP